MNSPYFGTPAAWKSPMAMDDFTHTAGAIIAIPPSPELDNHKQDPHQQLSFDFLHHPANNTRPPTPPHQNRDESFSELYYWYAQSRQSAASEPTQPSQVQSDYMPHLESNAACTYGNFQVDQSQCTKAGPRLHPRANLLHSSPAQLISQPSFLQMSPPIQEWPTHNLKMDETTRRRLAQYRQMCEARRAEQAQQTAGPTLSLQYQISLPSSSAHAQNDETRNSSIDHSHTPPTVQHLRRLVPGPEPDRHSGLTLPSQYGMFPVTSYHSQNIPQSGSSIDDSHTPTTLQHFQPLVPGPQPARHPGSYPGYWSQPPYRFVPGYHPILPPQQLPRLLPGPSLHSLQPAVNGPVRTARGKNQVCRFSANHEPYNRRHGLQPNINTHQLSLPPPPHSQVSFPHSPSLGGPPPPEPAPPEATYQPITTEYGAYRWPVELYELRSDTQFDFAQTYIDDWLERNVRALQCDKWHCHTSVGFIKGGNRFSILVLHNAASPFRWSPLTENTTSIGVYGRHAHMHEEIRWTTITPWIPRFFRINTDFVFKEKWNFDMPKASDKRLHRAYWLAANMLPLGGLLNHSGMRDKPHDALEEIETDESSVISTKDLQSSWSDGPPSKEDSERTWQKIKEEVEDKDVDALGSDHVEIGGTEREYEVD